MKTSKKRALAFFYENLNKTQRDEKYYLNPVGITRRNAILSLIQAPPHESICDLGCGEGLIVMKLLGANRLVFGSDISPGRAKLALANGVKALAADVTQLPHPDGCFDKVICSEVLEHLAEPSAAFSEIYRVLRPDGAAVLTVPLYKLGETTLLDLPEEVLEKGDYYDIKKKYNIKNTHLSEFDEATFLSVLAQNGFYLEDYTFTYNYKLKHSRLYKLAAALYRGVSMLAPRFWLRHALEHLVIRLILASHVRLDEKHHIIARARKVGA